MADSKKKKDKDLSYDELVAKRNELKKQYEEVDKEYQAIREKRALIKRKISWYEYSNEKLLHSYRQGLSYELFGKRKKDLTEEELKEYNRISAKRTREKKKGENENV